MSPEVLEGATEFSAFAFRQIDVYAAALVIWEVLSRTEFLPGNHANDVDNKTLRLIQCTNRVVANLRGFR